MIYYKENNDGAILNKVKRFSFIFLCILFFSCKSSQIEKKEVVEPIIYERLLTALTPYANDEFGLNHSDCLRSLNKPTKRVKSLGLVLALSVEDNERVDND